MNSMPRPNLGHEAPPCVLRCEPAGQEYRVISGSNLMDGIRGAMLPLAIACGGVGACGFCRVQILDGAENLSPIGQAEAEVLKKIGAARDERLACYVRVHGDIRLTTSYW